MSGCWEMAQGDLAGLHGLLIPRSHCRASQAHARRFNIKTSPEHEPPTAPSPLPPPPRSFGTFQRGSPSANSPDFSPPWRRKMKHFHPNNQSHSTKSLHNRASTSAHPSDVLSILMSMTSGALATKRNVGFENGLDVFRQCPA